MNLRTNYCRTRNCFWRKNILYESPLPSKHFNSNNWLGPSFSIFWNWIQPGKSFCLANFHYHACMRCYHHFLGVETLIAFECMSFVKLLNNTLKKKFVNFYLDLLNELSNIVLFASNAKIKKGCSLVTFDWCLCLNNIYCMGA